MFCNCIARTSVLRGCAAVAAVQVPTSLQSSPLAHAQESQEVGDQPAQWTFNWQWFERPDVCRGLKGPRWPGAATRAEEPSFTSAEVALHDGFAGNGTIWMTYRDGVYDVTDYVKLHPGGKFILSAAGGPVDSWWSYWAQHHVSPAVQTTLERLRIGRLADWHPEEDEGRRGGGIWAEEMLSASRKSNRQFTQRISEMPYQSVSLCRALSQAHLTPKDALFVRNHAPVPSISDEEAREYSIVFCLSDDKVATLTIDELQRRFRSNHVTSVLQCTGNRAADNICNNGFEKSGFVGSDDEFIGLGMLGNACWTGVRLCEVFQELIPAEARADWCGQDLHVTFEGLDGYYTSTPLHHIMNRETDCLLATEMNGEPLLPDHGFPVRAVLPGVAGARNVKWLNRVSVGPPSDSPWLRNYYLDKPSMTPCHNLPMNSVILSPEPGALIDAGETSICVSGVAYPGGTGRRMARVELSVNRGQHWQPACCRFDEVPRDDSSKPRGWVRFNANIYLPTAHELGCGGPLTEIWCRAFDDEGNVQPQRSEAHGGYMYNGYHKVPLVRAPLKNKKKMYERCQHLSHEISKNLFAKFVSNKKANAFLSRVLN